MAHQLTISLPKQAIGVSDIEVNVKSANKVIGRLRISKGLLVWLPRHHRKGYGFNWEYFDSIAKEKGEYGHK